MSNNYDRLANYQCEGQMTLEDFGINLTDNCLRMSQRVIAVDPKNDLNHNNEKDKEEIEFSNSD